MNGMESLSIKDLENKKTDLEDRIKRLEAYLKLPLEQDFSEQAVQLSDQLLKRKLLEVEKNNLRELNLEIEKKRKAKFDH
jgi:hypothetical protein